MEDTARCEKCVYWKRLSWSGSGGRACHFLLEAGRRREKDRNGVCASFKKKRLDKWVEGVTHWM